MASRKIGALWIRQTPGGVTYMSGVLQDLTGDIQIAIFKNDRKEAQNQPDYNIVLSEKREQRKEAAQDPFLSGPTPVSIPKVDPSEIPTVEDQPNQMKFPQEKEIDIKDIPF